MPGKEVRGFLWSRPVVSGLRCKVCRHGRVNLLCDPVIADSHVTWQDQRRRRRVMAMPTKPSPIMPSMPGSGTVVPPDDDVVLPPEVDDVLAPPEVLLDVLPPDVEEVVLPPEVELPPEVLPPEVLPPDVDDVVLPPEVELVDVPPLLLDVEEEVDELDDDELPP